MAVRQTPWIIAAGALALVIAFLSAMLLTREGTAVVAEAGDTATESAARVEVARADTAHGADASTATTPEARTDTRQSHDMVPTTEDRCTLLHGTVRTPSGPWIGDATVELHVGGQSDALVRAAWSDEASHYAIPRLTAGDYRLTVSAPGYRHFERAVAIPPGVPSLRVDVNLHPSWIVKVVLLAPDGRLLHDVLATEKDLPEEMFTELVGVIAGWRELPAHLPGIQWVTGMSVGRWSSNRQEFGHERLDLPARYAGTLEMSERRDAVIGAVMGQVVVAQQPVLAGQEEITLTIDPQRLRASTAGVRLQVVDAATGSPLPEARVGIDEPGSASRAVTVGADGRYERAHLRPGRYRVSVIAKERAATIFAVDLAPGAITDLGVVSLSAPVVVRIRVPELAAAEAPRCSLLPLDRSERGEIEAVRLHAAGAGIRAEVAPGRYLLRVEHGDRGALVELDTRRLGADPVVVTLTSAAVLSIDAAEVSDPVRFELCTSDGQQMGAWILFERRSLDVKLPPGDYRVRTQRIDGGRREERVTLPPEGTTLVLR